MEQQQAEHVTLNPHPLHIQSLESLRSKSVQIIESIQSLRIVLEQQNAPVMPTWPDILAKYNALLSQTHNFLTALSAGNVNSNAQLALHPFTAGLSDAQLDNSLLPLLNTQQTNDVLAAENDAVRRIAMALFAKEKGTEQDQVIRAVENVVHDHDTRATDALRAVTMLKDKFDWKTRVEVELEEPEELTWTQPNAIGREEEESSEGTDDDDDDDDDDDEDDAMET